MNGNEVRIRRAEVAELGSLEALLGHYFREEEIWETDTPEAISAYLRRADLGLDLGFYVAQVDGLLAGCVLCRRLPHLPGAAECKRLYVLPDFRRRGLATALMRAIENAAAFAGVHTMYLDSKDDFRTALALYRRLGYDDCERFNDNTQATVFLCKCLA